ncbi:MAG TPA: hypothetical protein VNZ56_15745 [Verrucomicrobiae bacterium]|jgi:hypothetical protein|nr:hypothetical protein [Verrucomicrobiae bacterium]
MSEMEMMVHGPLTAWSEAAALYRLGARIGDFASIRRDILPGRDTDPAMARYRRLCLSFFDHFTRLGRIPRKPPNLRIPKAPRPRPRQRVFVSRVPVERIAAIRAALRNGESEYRIRKNFGAGRPLICRIRRELQLEEPVHG